MLNWKIVQTNRQEVDHKGATERRGGNVRTVKRDQKLFQGREIRRFQESWDVIGGG